MIKKNKRKETTCYGPSCVPPNSYRSLHPGTTEGEYVKKGPLKRRSSRNEAVRMGYIHSAWCLYIRRKFGHKRSPPPPTRDTGTQTMAVWAEATDLSRKRPCWLLDLRLLTCDKMHFCCWSHQSAIFCYSSPSKLKHHMLKNKIEQICSFMLKCPKHSPSD